MDYPIDLWIRPRFDDGLDAVALPDRSRVCEEGPMKVFRETRYALLAILGRQRRQK